MKKSISFLPNEKKNDLLRIESLVLENVPTAEFIILYGSYARNDYVDLSERDEFGVPTVFRSDYDILVLTSDKDQKDVQMQLQRVDDVFFDPDDPDARPPLQIYNENIEVFNRKIREGRYFFTAIKKEGIVLYDSGNYKIPRARKLKYEEIGKQATEYFNEKWETATDFFDDAKYDYGKNKFKIASFHIHQVCENLYFAMRMVYTLRGSKLHNLAKLRGMTMRYSHELCRLFPNDTKEERRIFQLVKDAYVEARYNPNFLVTKEDLDILFPRVEKLFGITRKVCENRLAEYERLAKNEQRV